MTKSGFDKDRIIRLFQNDLSDDDASYLADMFCSTEKEDDLRGILFRQFDEVLAEGYLDHGNIERILHRIHYEINTRSAEKRKNKFTLLLIRSLRMAGIIIIIISLFWGVKGFVNDNLGKETWVEIKAPAWTRAQFSLPDGTTGWLNSNSGIRYNGNFNTDRQIILYGEAYFDVFKDKIRPFKVNTSNVVVKVLGTRFNISAYDNENNVEVVLEEGQLELNDLKSNMLRIMGPNELVILDKTKNMLCVELVEPKKYLSWTEGKLVFRNDPIDVIARRLERWYGVDVEVDGLLTEDLRLRATFIDEGLEDVLEILKRGLPIDYKIENRNIKPDETYTKKRVIISLKNK